MSTIASDDMSTFPPRDLAARILGVPSDERTHEEYDRSGRASRDAILALLPDDFELTGKRVLDFGCGTGRVLRHFLAAAPTCEYWACDIHEESVAWCQAHLPAHSFVCGKDPPMPLEDGQFDLIYAIAVFTHISLNWSEWLVELHRLLRPGGLLVATFHSRGLWSKGFAGNHNVDWDEDRTGMHVEGYAQSLVESCNAAVWLSKWWVREHWGRAFEILELRQTGFAEKGTEGDAGQGSVAMRRRGVQITPEDLRRPSNDPREAAAAQRSRDLLLMELGETVMALSSEIDAHARRAEALEEELRQRSRVTADGGAQASVQPAAPSGIAQSRARWTLRAIVRKLISTARNINETHAYVRDHLAPGQDAVRNEIERLRADTSAVSDWVRSRPAWHHDRKRVLEILRWIYYDEPRLRERLIAVRNTHAYRLAYTEPEPLVSVVMRTYDNYRMLGERSIPSILAQTYQNFEVVVIGDNAPPEAAAVVRSFGDARISYHNLNRRGPYPNDPRAMWFVAGVPPYNEGLRRARGRWIAPLDDDDEFRPNHIETLMNLARRDELELAYGQLLYHYADAAPVTLGVFPPANGQFGFQASVFHGELRFFELELAESMFEIADDWAAVERMLRAGVRMGMLDEVVTDYFPASEFTPRGYIIPSPVPE
jgi:SAM-dependent methyltransferase